MGDRKRDKKMKEKKEQQMYMRAKESLIENSLTEIIADIKTICSAKKKTCVLAAEIIGLKWMSLKKWSIKTLYILYSN